VNACRESETAQRYVAGRLSPTEIEAFELHLLACEQCREEVRLGDLLAPTLAASRTNAPLADRDAYRERRPERRATEPVLTDGRPVSRRRRPSLMAASLAVAAVLVLAVVIRTGPDARDLGGVIPPPFIGAAARSTVPSGAFADAGMDAYRAGDHALAAELLGRAAASDSSPAVAFYLGVSRLVAGDATGALLALARPRGLDGSPYQDDARYFAAKAQIRLGHADSALAILRSIRGRDEASALADSLEARKP
jgi:hypothetical protein